MLQPVWSIPEKLRRERGSGSIRRALYHVQLGARKAQFLIDIAETVVFDS